MRISGHWLKRQIAGWLALVLLAPLIAASQEQETSPSLQAERVPPAQAQSQDSGNGQLNGGAVQTQMPPSSFPDSPGSVRSQTSDGNRQVSEQPSSPQPPSPQVQQNGTSQPVGTAAAPSVKATGVAASQPAGAAIAPAKQRRARSILIKVGALVGAGVAVGTVAALSSASPSRPR